MYVCISHLHWEFNFIKIDRPSASVFDQRRHHALFNMQPACDRPKKVTHNNRQLQLSCTGPSHSLHKNQFLVYFCTRPAPPRNCMSFFANYTHTRTLAANCLIARRPNALKSTGDEFCKLLSFCQLRSCDSATANVMSCRAVSCTCPFGRFKNVLPILGCHSFDVICLGECVFTERQRKKYL